MHVCPMVTGTAPHVGGPILPPCVPTVLVGSIPVAVVGNPCVCVGPPDSIMMGSTTVFAGGRLVARIGDRPSMGGRIVVGFPTAVVGG